MLTVSQLSKSFAGRALFDDVALHGRSRDDVRSRSCGHRGEVGIKKDESAKVES